MFGGLHIEMAALRSIGNLLQGSGWTGALVEAGVASSGTADSFLSASSVTRTRQVHQITACCLYKLLKAAYTDYCTDSTEHPDRVLSFEDWCERYKQQSPQFQFWDLVLSMELVIFSLIRAFREANFTLYCQALSELIPYFFANNNVNYARWLPVHLRDMLTLHQIHPELALEFHNGRFVVHKSSWEFSAMAIDQAHEQANALIKGDGGAVSVTEDSSALRRWMVAGPEVSHLVAQYEAASEAKDASKHIRHHEQTEQVQRVFFEKADRLYKAMNDMGNPFQEETGDLLTLDTKDIAHPSAAEMQKVLKEDCQLFSKLFISCQSRECDLQEFFRHENQSFPAALSDSGKLHTCQKPQLAAIFEDLVPLPDTEPKADGIIIDGSTLINSLPPRTSKTFDEYAALDVLPTIQVYSSKYERTDIVFDVYRKASLKAETRSRRGLGARRRVTDNGKVPRNWRSFLRENDNKTELFNFLADKIVRMHTPNTVIVTKEEDTVSNQSG
ncbi:hypothetical protein SKAU_G00210250 [Synaphobranchus kaupii]|uniref:Uncharacterized protein n=1 Tax=Synaphobranchus kaupii TaxID=118154 RepID=A0A9Q1F973_SYNKA|nr:hypothetical protein SKAU_G00210250 [Synaphobranchus kaupii]